MAKKRVNVSIDEAVLAEARSLDLNLSRFLEEKLAEHSRQARGRRWQEENREAINAYKKRIERDGLWNRDLISF